MGANVTIDTHDGAMEAYVAEPGRPGRRPAIVELHHRDGVELFTTTFCDALAAQGYVAVAPDLFHRRPKDEDRTGYRKYMTDALVLRDAEATVAWLKTRENVDADRLALVGHCMGGHLVWTCGALLPVFSAMVVYYGSDVHRAWGAGDPPIALAQRLSCPVLGFFGKADANPSPADMEALAAVMDRHGKPHEFHAYEGAVHAFQNFRYPERFHKQASDDSQARMLAFLDRHLRSG